MTLNIDYGELNVLKSIFFKSIKHGLLRASLSGQILKKIFTIEVNTLRDYLH